MSKLELIIKAYILAVAMIMPILVIFALFAGVYYLAKLAG